MNVDSFKSLDTRLLAILALAFSLICCDWAMAQPDAEDGDAQTSSAEEKEKSDEQSSATEDSTKRRTIPKTLMAPSTLERPLIRWRNGETLVGDINAADKDIFEWNTELFKEPLRLRNEVIDRIDFAKTDGKKDELANFRAILKNGSHLSGDLASISTETVTLKSDSLGELEIDQTEVVSIERITGAGIIASGSHALLAGEALGKGRYRRSAPYLAAGGQVASLAFNGGIKHKPDLPESFLMFLKFRSPDVPQFRFSVRINDEWISAETWGDELVLVKGEQFAFAKVVGDLDAKKPQPAELTVQLAWDRKDKRCVLFDENGVQLADLHVDDKQAEELQKQKKNEGNDNDKEELIGLEDDPFAGPSSRQEQLIPDEGIAILNRGAGMLIEEYRILEWDGNPPVANNANKDEITVVTDAAMISGTPQEIQEGILKLLPSTDAEPIEVSLDSLREIRWPREANVERAASTTEVWFANGNLVRGELQSVADNRVTMKTVFSKEPVSVSLARARAMVMPSARPSADAEAEEKATPLDEMDTITVGELKLHGKFEATGEKLPAFRAVGAEDALLPAAKDAAILRYIGDPGQGGQPPALLHVAADESAPKGETWPISLKSITKSGLEFEWDATETTNVDLANVYAVQFTLPQSDNSGFDGPGWVVIGRGKGKYTRKEGAITLPPNRGIGNAYLLHGGDFGFTMSPRTSNGLASMRIRMFCQGTAAESDSMNFLIAHYGSQIYCGREMGRTGQFADQHSFNVDSSTPAKILMKLSGDKVELWVNDIRCSTGSIKEHRGRRSGAGVILESTSVWGNAVGNLTLSDFVSPNSLNLPAPPPFSANALDEALLLPRVRRDVPPRHILIGRNGDLLRGEVEAMTSSQVSFRLGLEKVRIPGDRLAAIVWVDQPAEEDENEGEDDAKKDETGEKVENADEVETVEIADTGQWLDMIDGGRMRLDVEKWTKETVVGLHPLLGRCSIPTSRIYHVSLKNPEPGGGWVTLADWQFKKTVDPAIPGSENAEKLSPLIGKEAEDFTLPLLNDEKFVLSNARGKVVVLDFWATWCAPCVRSLPGLIEAMGAYPSDELEFIGINQGESKQQVQRFLETRGMKLKVALDANMLTGRKYGAEAIPYSVVIDSKGKIAGVATGAGANSKKLILDAVEKAIANIDPNDKPKVEETAAEATGEPEASDSVFSLESNVGAEVNHLNLKLEVEIDIQVPALSLETEITDESLSVSLIEDDDGAAKEKSPDEVLEAGELIVVPDKN